MVYLKNINYLIYKTVDTDNECLETYLVGDSCKGDEHYRDQCDDKPVTNTVTKTVNFKGNNYNAISSVTADCSQSCYQNETNINCETYFKNTATEFTVCATSMATCLGCHETCLALDCLETYLSRVIDCGLKEANDNIATLEGALEKIEISNTNVNLIINTSTVDGVTKSVIEADGVLTQDDITAITDAAGGDVNLQYTLGSNTLIHNTASNTFTTTASFDSTNDDATNFIDDVVGNVAVDANYSIELGNYTGVTGATTKVVKEDTVTTISDTNSEGELIETTAATLTNLLALASTKNSYGTVIAKKLKAKVEGVTVTIDTTLSVVNGATVKKVAVDDVTSDNVANMITTLSDGLFGDSIAGVTYRVNMEDNNDNRVGTAGFQFGDYTIPAVDLVMNDEVTTFGIPKLARGTITFNNGTDTPIKVTGRYKNGVRSTNKGYLELEQGSVIKYIGKKTFSTGEGAITEPKEVSNINSIDDANYLDRNKVFPVSISYLKELGFSWTQTLGRGFGLGLGSTFGALDPNPILSVDIGDVNNNILAGVETKFKINLSRVNIEKSKIIVSYTDNSAISEIISDDEKVLNVTDNYLEVELGALTEDTYTLDITYIDDLSFSLQQITFKTVDTPTTISYSDNSNFEDNENLVFFKDNRFRQTGNEFNTDKFNTDKFLVRFTDTDLQTLGEEVTPGMEVKVEGSVVTTHPFNLSESADSNSGSGFVNYELTIDSGSDFINQHKSYTVTFTAVDKKGTVFTFDSNGEVLTINDGDFDDDGIPNTEEDADEVADDPIDFSSTVVSDKDFNGMNIYNTTFGSTKFENCDFRGTNFHNCKFSGDRTIFTSCILHNAKFINILTESDIKIQTGNTFVIYIGISSSMYTVTHSKDGNNDIFTVKFKVSGLPTLLQDTGSTPTTVNAKEIYNAILVRIYNYTFESSAPDSLDYFNLLVTNHNLTISDNSYTVYIETISEQSQQFSGLVKNIPANNTVINSSTFSQISNAESPTTLQTVRILRADSTSEIDPVDSYYIVGDFTQSIKGVGSVQFITSEFPKRIIHSGTTYLLGDSGDIRTITLSGVALTFVNGSLLMTESPKIIPQTLSLNTYTSLTLRLTFESIRKLTNLAANVKIDRVEISRDSINITDSTGAVVNSFTIVANNNISELTLANNTSVEFDINITVYLKNVLDENGEMSNFSGDVTISAQYLKGMGLTLGDPHITTVSGATYELPYKVADYRLIQGKDLIVNVSTRRLTIDEGKAIKKYYKEVTKRTPPKSLITSGVFYERVIVFYKSSVINFSFSKDSVQKIGNQIKLLNKHTLRINDSELGEITLKFDYLNNPQEKYGIQLSCSRPEKLSGLLLDEYIAESMMIKGLLDKKPKNGVLGKNKVLSKFFKVKKN